MAFTVLITVPPQKMVAQNGKEMEQIHIFCSLLYIAILCFQNPLHDAEAVHRYYKSHPQSFNDEQPGRKEVAVKVKDQSKKNMLQKRASLFSHVYIQNY